MKQVLSIIAALVLAASCAPQLTEQEKTNIAIYDRVYEAVADKADLPTGELALAIAKEFLGTDYVSYTLEIEPEALQVFLDKTDCILFVELCSSFALTVKGLKIEQGSDPVAAKPSYKLLCHNIQNMRYRGGVVDGYASRLHYTSEWLIQNAANGVLNEYTSELGEEFEQQFFFMTTHPDSYKQLLDNPEETARVRAAEEYLESCKPYYYISQERLMQDEVISQIKDGDIVTFIDKHPGLDLAHVAMACTGEDGQMHFIHASYGAKKVIFEPRTLAEYAKNGIRISRLK